jgi:ribosomal protein L40E
MIIDKAYVLNLARRKICQKCKAKNTVNAKICRVCHKTKLRDKKQKKFKK